MAKSPRGGAKYLLPDRRPTAPPPPPPGINPVDGSHKPVDASFMSRPRKPKYSGETTADIPSYLKEANEK